MTPEYAAPSGGDDGSTSFGWDSGHLSELCGNVDISTRYAISFEVICKDATHQSRKIPPNVKTHEDNCLLEFTSLQDLQAQVCASNAAWQENVVRKHFLAPLIDITDATFFGKTHGGCLFSYEGVKSCDKPKRKLEVFFQAPDASNSVRPQPVASHASPGPSMVRVLTSSTQLHECLDAIEDRCKHPYRAEGMASFEDSFGDRDSDFAKAKHACSKVLSRAKAILQGMAACPSDGHARKKQANSNDCISAIFMRDISAAVTPATSGEDPVNPDGLRDACENHVLREMPEGTRKELQQLIERWRKKQQARNRYLMNRVIDSKTKQWRIRKNAKDHSADMPGLRKTEQEKG